MNNAQFTAEFAAQFKRGYANIMGGTQTIIMPNGQRFDFDDRRYLAVNRRTKHTKHREYVVTQADIERIQQRAEKDARIAEAEKNGVYSLEPGGNGGQYVELSDREKRYNYFSVERLAKTLGITESDAALLNSSGKTYVFAEKLDGSGMLELFHPSLSCNDLSIWVGPASPQRLAKFQHEEWASAPFADMVGQTEAKNHFVC